MDFEGQGSVNIYTSVFGQKGAELDLHRLRSHSEGCRFAYL